MSDDEDFDVGQVTAGGFNSAGVSPSKYAAKAADVLEHENIELRDKIDSEMGFPRYSFGPARCGWLANMQQTLVDDPNWPEGRSGVDFYFIQEDGECFKSTLLEGRETEVEEYVRRKFEMVENTRRLAKEDLDLPNHLLGLKRTYLKLFFRNCEDLLEVRRAIFSVINKNVKSRKTEAVYDFGAQGNQDDDGPKSKGYKDGIEYVTDIREHDVPYVTRVAIDHEFRVGLWYKVSENKGTMEFVQLVDRILPADPVIMAFDIETSKLPLKFPDVAIDQVMMISYMINGQGYLITNRDIVSADIEDFDYSPKPGEYDGPFIVFNEADEESLLKKFFEEIRIKRPCVYVTYNGDFFDWPFIEARAKIYGISMYQSIGIYKNKDGDYNSFYGSHMDAYKWVKRDSYLPVGSQGLKAVTKYKLGYDPKELDPELMTPYAASHPHVLADYSVSDAVATFYLYMKYVHPFVFSLCNIIPMSPDDVLRKGSGTLCEMLLMVEAYRANVIMPNKSIEQKGKFFDGHLLESETYVGGHVEALESGVFRSDIPTNFRLDPTTLAQLISDVDRALRFSIEMECKRKVEEVTNYAEIRDQIIGELEHLRMNPHRKETPLIYHLDVAAMYPNIILTNRLQPPALVTEENCAACDFNRPESNCQRKMQWSWRGEFFPADRSEYNMIRNQLESESFPPKFPNGPKRNWNEMSANDQNTLLKKRVSDYSRKVYRRIHETRVEEKESTVCQRENSFYVDTVKNFRDRRYEYKDKLKKWKANLESSLTASDIAAVENAKKMIVVMDSLQLAHKCILNSFYGYVMRKGSRWYSMEMAGIVCLTGAKIIQMARQIVEKIGRPLELDTDGIWCILPRSFPENYKFTLADGKSLSISYPCVMLNHLVHDKFTNDQYQTLTDPEEHTYQTSSENSIFFEVDGPYRAMILPASKEEDKLLKKRYAVFNDNGTMAELKGFELKRRGELKIVKIFQEEVFRHFLGGSTLEECYAHVAAVANRWLDVLYTRGANVDDDDLLEYISENRSMSKTLEEYGTQKSTSISTAKRLAEILGSQMVKDKGLACKFIISIKPFDAPVAERAIPVVIFSMEMNVRLHFLRKWLKDSSLTSCDVRDILDWNYYIERLGSSIQKLITIPAAMQKVSNPVPRLVHPDWLLRRTRSSVEDYQQRKITDMFPKKSLDMEDIGSVAATVAANVPVAMDIAPAASDEQPKAVKPSVFKDYRGWLEFESVKWLKALKNRKSGKRKRPADMSVFLTKQQRSIFEGHWEILQIAATEAPGEYRLWALIDKALHSFKFEINRKFFVNCRLPDDSGERKSCSKILPRSIPSFYLYEFNVKEKDFLQNSEVYKSFAWHHDTLGVFETKMPLNIRALLQVGSVCSTVPKRMAKKSLDSVFYADDLYRAKVASDAYLAGSRLKFIFFYHSHTDNRQVFGIFFLASGTASILVVDPFKNQAVPNISRLYREALEKFQGDETSIRHNGDFELPQQFAFDLTFHDSEKSAFKSIQKIFSHYQKEKSGGASFIMMQSPRPADFFTEHVRIMLEFPTMTLMSNKRDNQYPALDWQKFAVQRALRGLAYSRDCYLDQLLLSRYAQVPISNIEGDPVVFIADLLFARILAERDLVSWYSTTTRPDLGGREEDDNDFVTEDLVDPEINFPACYNTICIEFDIENIAINTILQSSNINEVEGSDGNAGLSNADMTTIDSHLKKEAIIIDPNSPSFQSFRCLKDLVRSWAKDFHLMQSPVAKVLLKNFYRWLSSSSSRLHEPALVGYVHSLMKKVLMQLLAEFKRLGSKIIYASFNKVVIMTTKTSMDTARSYIDFVLKSMRSKDTFAFIDIKCKRLWHNLLWLDADNFVGLEERVAVAELDENEPFETKLAMEWGIAEFLPPFIQRHFKESVGEFVERLHEIALQGAKENKESALEKLMIKQHFTRKLLTLIPQIQRTVSGLGDEDLDPVDIRFPVLPGSHLHMENPTLELIKFICLAFGLHGDIQDEVRLMRRNLLNLIGVAEFGKDSEFTNPCESFVLPHVICSYCQHCRDIDLAFDVVVRKSGSSDKSKQQQLNSSMNGWRCNECLHEYDQNVIEEMLVHIVHKSILAYQIQDVQCIKCKQIKCENIRDHCKGCAEKYELVGRKSFLPEVFTESNKKNPLAAISEVNLKRKLNVLKNIAEMNKMTFLAQVVETLGCQ